MMDLLHFSLMCLFFFPISFSTLAALVTFSFFFLILVL